MRKLALLAAVAAAAIPTFAVAADPAPGTPDPHSTAQKNCRAQRAQIGDAAFKDLYGTNQNKSNAFGKCVSKQQATVTRIDQQATANASQQCRAERQTLGEDAFQDKYSTNKNKHNPHGTNGFGRCVSGKAKAQATQANAQQNQSIINAAKTCKAERKDIGADAFKAKYGTNKNKSNAFGRCVSKQRAHNA
jgi:hypothetical protein